MRKLIELDSEKRKMICEVKGVTQANLTQALKFQRNSDKSVAMRIMAMENGGMLFLESGKWDKQLLK